VVHPSVLEKRGQWLLAIVALALYVPSLANQLTNWDDANYTSESPFVTAGPKGALDAFTVTYHGAYIPLTHAVLTLVGFAGPAKPLPYHVLQWLVLALAVALMPKALSAFGLSRRVTLLATLLWLAHPFRVESASWVGNFKDTLSLLFATAAFAAYASERRWLSTVLFTLGLLAKASLAPLAPFFLVLEWRHSQGRRIETALSSLRWILPSLVLGAYAGVVHRAFLPVREAVFEPTTPLLTPLWYLGRVLWPVDSRAVYGWEAPRGTEVATLIVVWLVIVVAVVLGFRSRAPGAWRAFSWGALAYLLPLLPFSGLVPQVHVVAERYTLFPSMVVALLLAAMTARLGLAGSIATIALTCALAVPNVLRQRQWHDAVTLWEANVEDEPSSVVARLNYGGALGGVGRFDEALRELLVVRELAPQRPKLDCFVAMARAGKEKLDPTFAVDELGALCQTPPSQRWALAAPIIARKDAGARLVLDEIAFGPDRSKAAATGAALALERNEFDRALALATQARIWEPGLDRALVTQVLALIKLKRLEEADALAQTPVSDARAAARLLGLRAAVQNERGNYVEAEALLRQSTEHLRALGDRP
jgi:tetratricopeptide (TPR) repeat protein